MDSSDVVQFVSAVSVAMIIAGGPILLVYVNRRKDKQARLMVEQEAARAAIIAESTERTAKQVAEATLSLIAQKLDTGNGHTAGAGIANIEKQVTEVHERAERLEEGQRLIREDVRRLQDGLTDHITSNRDIAERMLNHLQSADGHKEVR